MSDNSKAEKSLPWIRRLVADSHRGGPGSIPSQSMWDLWWKKWHWDKFFPEYFGFPMSISFHQCSTTRKKKKLIIFITGLHNKPQGCGASVASAAAGPFTPPPKRKEAEKTYSERCDTYLCH